MKSRSNRAFTLIELLVVIAIIGILAALIAPTIANLRKGDTGGSATRQLLDAVAHARQLAISQRTTVYMVFLPTNYWADPAYAANLNLVNADRVVATNLLDKQLVGYTFVSLRSLGDQPGRNIPKYLSSWHTLPAGAMISLLRFTNSPNAYSRIFTNASFTGNGLDIYGFNTTTNIPFPRAETAKYSLARPYVQLPYIAFNYLGQLTTEELSPAASPRDEHIPLAYGAVSPAINLETKAPIFGDPFIDEQPAGNSTNDYNVVYIDWLTGRPRIVRQEFE